MKFALYIVLSLFSNLGFSQTGSFQGEYMSGGPTGEDPFQLLQIHYKKNGDIFFYMEVGRGAPSYNGGSMYGRLTNKNGHLQYLPKDTTEDCSLDFVASGNSIVVKTISGECGFGQACYPDGIYEKKKNSNPAYFIDRKGHKIYFEKTTPEQWEL